MKKTIVGFLVLCAIALGVAQFAKVPSAPVSDLAAATALIRTSTPTTMDAVRSTSAVSTVAPVSADVRVCKGGGVSLGWVPCGSVTCASMSANGGACKDSLTAYDLGKGATYSRIAFGVRNNTEMKAVQKMLLDLGYLTNETQVTGNYLSVTKTAIRNFQKENGLKADGIWGPTTKGVLENLHTAVGAEPTTSEPAELYVCKGGGVSKGWAPCGMYTCGKIGQSGGMCKFSW